MTAFKHTVSQICQWQNDKTDKNWRIYTSVRCFWGSCTGIVGLQNGHQRAHYFTWKLAILWTQIECYYLKYLYINFSTCYVELVLLNYTFPFVSPLRPDITTQVMQSSMPAVWVKMSSSWLGLGLYLWTLIAPLIFPDRDFNWARPVF